MSDIRTRSLMVQLHHAAMPVGGGSAFISQGLRKINVRMSYRAIFDDLEDCAPYQLVKIHLFDSVTPPPTSRPNDVATSDFDDPIGDHLAAFEDFGVDIKLLRFLVKKAPSAIPRDAFSVMAAASRAQNKQFVSEDDIIEWYPSDNSNLRKQCLALAQWMQSFTLPVNLFPNFSAVSSNEPSN